MGGAAVSSNTLEPEALGIFPGLPLSYPCRRFRCTESKNHRYYTCGEQIVCEKDNKLGGGIIAVMR